MLARGWQRGERPAITLCGRGRARLRKATMRRVLVPLTFAMSVVACKKSTPPPDPEAVVQPAASPKSTAPPRCAPVSAQPPFVLGPGDTGRTPHSNGDAGESGRDDILPFAAEVGDGVAYRGGFAV